MIEFGISINQSTLVTNMFAEKHQDSGFLEQEFRRSLKQYRSLLRWGIDKVFSDTGAKIEALFGEVQQCLDKNNVTQAGSVLEELSSHLREMEQKYPEKKNKIIAYVNESICSLENTLNKNLNIVFSGDGEGVRENMLRELECARVALQNDDWEEAKRVSGLVFKNYIEIRQKKLFGDQYSSLDDGELVDVQQKLQNAFESGVACRLLPASDLDNMFQMAEARNIVTLRIGVFGSEAAITTLFSDISQKQIKFDNTSGGLSGQAAIMRISVGRTMTIYMVGIPCSGQQSVSQVRHLTNGYSSVFLDAGHLLADDEKMHELILSCTEQLPVECVNFVDAATGENALYRVEAMQNILVSALDMQQVVERIHKTVDKALIYR